jgi:hypothetical protein
MIISSSVPSSLLALEFAGIHLPKRQKKENKIKSFVILLVWQEYDDIL